MYLKKSILSVFILFATLLVITATFASASGIQDRMKARIPQLTELKNSGIIGENNQGYLEYLNGKSGEEKLVNSENGDRKKVYTAIGKKQKVTAAQVGQRRAAQLSQQSIKGHWYQDKAGKWSQK